MPDRWEFKSRTYDNCNCAMNCGWQFNLPSTHGYRRVSAASKLWVAVVLAVVVVGCVPPDDRRPGLGLRGEVAEQFPPDWSFTDEHHEIAIEVHTPYLLRHSVTVWCASVDEQLYVGASYPEAKRWPGWVDREPNVRLEIAGRIYEARLAPFDDLSQLPRLLAAYARKYDLPDAPPGGRAPSRYWLVESRG